MIQLIPAAFPPQNTAITDQKGTLTTPWMGFLRALFLRTGESNGIPIAVANSVNVNLAPTLSADWNYLVAGTVLPLQFVVLPALTGGQLVMVQNASGLTVDINAPAGATIDGNPSYSLITAKMQIFWFISPTIIVSTQLG